jgi:uncharacterized protein (TIGR02996 family)
MNEDEGFIREIIAHPDDTSLRLIYADWLEERGDARGEFLRLEATLSQMAEENRLFKRLRARLRKLREGISADWLARLDSTAIENCDLQFNFVCPKRWEKLQMTSDCSVRFCDSCREKVFYSSSVEEARRHALAGRCVAVDSRLARQPKDLEPVPMVLGRMALPPIKQVSNKRVTITKGALKGLQGEVEQVYEDGPRVRVRLILGGQSTSVVLSLNQVERA